MLIHMRVLIGIGGVARVEWSERSVLIVRIWICVEYF